METTGGGFAEHVKREEVIQTEIKAHKEKQKKELWNLLKDRVTNWTGDSGWDCIRCPNCSDTVTSDIELNRMKPLKSILSDFKTRITCNDGFLVECDGNDRGTRSCPSKAVVSIGLEDLKK